MITIRERGKIAVGLFILSEANFFLLLVIAYVYYHAYPGPGPTAASALNPMRTGIFSLALFSSSATIWMAARASRRPDSRGLVMWLTITIALGVLFLFGQAREYYDLIAHGITISRNLFATTFFTLTGFHGLHVIAGLVALSITLGLARAGKLHQHDKDGFGAVEWYWHFVDAVWVVVFSVVYLWGVVAS
jgi:heme/copper-type cytochrome/quinol oxidase subunit 3